MLCWSAVAYTPATADEPLIITGAETTYTDAHRAAGDAALAALGHLAGHRPGATVFVSITVDGTALLIAAASADRQRLRRTDRCCCPRPRHRHHLHAYARSLNCTGARCAVVARLTGPGRVWANTRQASNNARTS